ncbi:hypothetical protein PQQ99_19085 [Paraburkholderia sediminicola]
MKILAASIERARRGSPGGDLHEDVSLLKATPFIVALTTRGVIQVIHE